jgi:hypothetical protein
MNGKRMLEAFLEYFNLRSNLREFDSLEQQGIVEVL